jgi:hypothetical protein
MNHSKKRLNTWENFKDKIILIFIRSLWKKLSWCIQICSKTSQQNNSQPQCVKPHLTSTHTKLKHLKDLEANSIKIIIWKVHTNKSSLVSSSKRSWWCILNRLISCVSYVCTSSSEHLHHPHYSASPFLTHSLRVIYFNNFLHSEEASA